MRRFLLFLMVSTVTLCASAANHYVSQTGGSNSNDGLSWANAMQTIASGFSACANGDTLFIAAGTYNEHVTLTASKNLSILGGYSPDGTQHDPEAFETIMDGTDLGKILIKSESEPAAPIVIDGLILQNANYASSSSAVYVRGNMTVSNCIIRKCHSGSSGGAIYVDDIVSGKPATISNCLFELCTADGGGGAIYNKGALIEKCIFRGCSGVYATVYNKKGKIENCIFHNNSAANTDWPSSGGVYNPGGTITNCTFANNSGAMYAGIHSDSYVYNSVMWGNRAEDGFADPVNYIAGSPSSNNIADQGLSTGTGAFFSIALNEDNKGENGPHFVAPTNFVGVPKNTAQLASMQASDWSIEAGSFLIDKGKADRAPATDLAGVERPVGANVDVGAYERVKYYTITYIVNPIMGKVHSSTITGYMDSVTFEAMPNYGFHFVQWNDSITDNPRSFVLTQDTAFTAEFEKNEYTIVTESNYPIWGTSKGDTAALYLDTIGIVAISNEGYHFAQWSDGVTDNPRSIVLTQDTTFTAIFAKNIYAIDKQADSLRGNIVGPEQAEYLDSVIITANQNYGYHFVQWSDSVTDNPRTIVLTQDTIITAEFAKNEYAITTEPNNPEWGTTFGDTTAFYLDTVSISAIPKYGYHFVQWSDKEYVCDSYYWNGDCYYGHWLVNTEPNRTVMVTENTTYTALFAKNTYSITKIATNGSISGPSQAEYVDNITLTAVPNYGYHFTQWSDGVTDNPRTFILTNDTAFTAEFAISRTGTCGDDNLLTWTYEPNTKFLTISGNGSLNSNYTFGLEAPTQAQMLMVEDGITSIGYRAFTACSKLAELTILNGDAEIGEQIILDCLDLTQVVGPAQIFEAQEISWFGYTKQLYSVVINGGELTDNVLSVIKRSYKTLKTLDALAASNTSLSDEAFAGCYNLQTLILPINLASINYMAVADCKNLQSIVIPAFVMEIDQSAFENCRSLASVEFTGNALTRIGNWAFYNCHALSSINIPAGVTEIGAGAFYGCTYLNNLSLPASVQSIGDNAFALCSKLTKMEVKAVIPPSVEDKTFFEVSTEAPVYVPNESVAAYKSHPVWGRLNIIGKSDDTQAIGNANANAKADKIFRDGQILILRGDKVYTTTGQLVK